MRVIVTGAGGFIGKHTVRYLLGAAYEVVAIDLDLSRLKSDDCIWLDPRLDAFEADITDAARMKNIIQQNDVILHLAAVARFGPADSNPQLAVKVNIEGTVNLIRAGIEKGANRFIFSSTGSVYSTKSQVPIRESAPREPSSVYGLTKKMAEDWIMYYSEELRYVILRYGYVYGEGKDWGAVGAFLAKLAKDEAPTIFGGTQTNDFVYVKDVATINELAIRTKYTNQDFNVGTGQAVSIRDVYDICARAMKSDLKPEMKPLRSFDFPVFVYDISKARSLLEYDPHWSLFDGISDTVRTMRIGKTTD